MFFPLRDENPTRRTAYVNYGLIALNIVAYVATVWLQSEGETWLPQAYGLIPRRFVADPSGELWVVFSSMFLHTGWVHLASNLVFLHLFGDNLEDVLGPLRYLAFYLGCGLCAALLQVMADTGSPVPMIGASGAIAGLIGGYLILYPRAPVLSVTTIPLLWLVLPIFPVIPAWWIAAEFFVVNAYGALVAWSAPLTDSNSQAAGGVAVFAHLGGLFAGVATVWRSRHTHREGVLLWKGYRRDASESEGAGRKRWKRTRRLGE